MCYLGYSVTGGLTQRPTKRFHADSNPCRIACPSTRYTRQTSMNTRLRAHYTATALIALLALGACGGGDDDSGSASAATDKSCQALTSDGSSVVVGSNVPGDPALPEPASGYRVGLKAVYAKKFIVTT